ncbi:type II secretion system F family protein [[Mycobacterium] burgundiense]|uniref:Type II secretion system F family protein n=1 Tax=[Mycobacterium] burgundiense TaxID=3064286 RepID=A0ABM9L9L2_9MYCO|nr:type II secretion system F family protein [Mycolicibacterium sp. MU0053]CAJ1495213.1 type II secretion system F family protein [Mycolicibacterium sp. MU0053]
MSALTGAALSLAAALVIAPDSPRRRLAPHRARTALRRAGRVVVPVSAGAVLVWAGPFIAVAAALLGGTLWIRRRRRSAQRRYLRDGTAMAEALEMLTAELRVGSHPVQGFAAVAREAAGQVGAGFQAVAARALLGADVSAGLRAAAQHSARGRDWERMAVFWALAADHGLAVAALMRAAQRDIIERQRFDARVEAGMAGARATTAILAGLPVVGILLGQAMGAAPVAFLIGGGAGGWLLVGGVVLACCGLLWADHITSGAVA